jgi:hypothetical protein
LCIEGLIGAIIIWLCTAGVLAAAGIRKFSDRNTPAAGWR